MSAVFFSYVLPLVHVMACLFLIVVVLLQTGKGADMGAVLGGGSQTLFGASGAGNLLTKLTTGMAITFMATSLLIVIGQQRKPSSSLLDRLPQTPPPAAAPEVPPPAAAPEAAAPQPAPGAPTAANVPAAPAAPNAAPGAGVPASGATTSDKRFTSEVVVDKLPKPAPPADAKPADAVAPATPPPPAAPAAPAPAAP